MFRRVVCAVIVLAACGSMASAQDWARKMFDHLTHDFGSVARGAKAEHRFTIKNEYQEEAEIASVTSTCGCTTPKIDKRKLKAWETTEILATIDTRNFQGTKEASLKVQFVRPFPAEVVLHVSVFIRGDVVVQPGVLDFGSVAKGSPIERKATISYAGRSDWQIVSVEANLRNWDVQMYEVGRTAGQLGGVTQVNYELSVKVKPNASPGYLKDQLILVTNDPGPRPSRVPVPLEALIASEGLSVVPSPLTLVANSKQTVTKHLVIQGQSPFRVTGVTCKDARFHFKVPTEAKKVHMIPVEFTAGDAPGSVSQTIHIATDASGNPDLDVSVQIQIMSGGSGSGGVLLPINEPSKPLGLEKTPPKTPSKTPLPSADPRPTPAAR